MLAYIPILYILITLVPTVDQSLYTYIYIFIVTVNHSGLHFFEPGGRTEKTKKNIRLRNMVPVTMHGVFGEQTRWPEGHLDALEV